jgi:hypothetical protein
MDSSRSGQGEGGAQGASSDGSPSAEEPTQGDGDMEIPIGIPVTEDEYRRLKEAARRHEQSSDAANEEAQQNDVEGDEEN